MMFRCGGCGAIVLEGNRLNGFAITRISDNRFRWVQRDFGVVVHDCQEPDGMTWVTDAELQTLSKQTES